ncbi:MAG: phytanoyl-CoA dioxygenase family protein [Chitinophagales bacterium]
MKWINQYTGILRQIRWFHWLNNCFHLKYLKRNKAIYKQFGIKRSVTKSIDSRILSRYVGDIKTFHPKGFAVKGKVSQLSDFPEAIQEAMKDWEQKGYLFLPGFLSPGEVSAINGAIEEGLKLDRLHYNYTGRKIFNAHQQIASIDQVAKHPLLLKILEYIFQDDVIHFQSINFNKGSEQSAHSDSIHMTTLPLGYLAGVWVALEPIHENNGPLTYYPGTHQLPYILNADYGNSSNAFLLDGNANEKYEQKVKQVVETSGLKEVELRANPGDVFIWHANLLHGGAAIKDPKATRKSMVFHYFAQSVLCFHEISERPAVVK